MILTDVISYRTEKGDELKKLAEKQNISLSQLTSNIIDEYLQFHVITQNYDMYRESKEVISLCFELLEETNVDKVIALHTKGAIQSIKTIIQEYSFENISDLIRSWFKFNSFNVEEFDKDGNHKFVCKNNMSENWNVEISTTIVNIYKYFGYEGIVESKEKGLFSYKISKTKSH